MTESASVEPIDEITLKLERKLISVLEIIALEDAELGRIDGIAEVIQRKLKQDSQIQNYIRAVELEHEEV